MPYRQILGYLGLLILCSSCSTFSPDNSRSDGQVVHVVVCWLKNPGDETARSELISTSKEFIQIPGVLQVSAGDVLVGQRPGLDSTFDLAVVIRFKSEQALHAYENHPIHRMAVQEKLMPLVKKFVIYDFIEK